MRSFVLYSVGVQTDIGSYKWAYLLWIFKTCIFHHPFRRLLTQNVIMSSILQRSTFSPWIAFVQFRLISWTWKNSRYFCKKWCLFNLKHYKVSINKSFHVPDLLIETNVATFRTILFICTLRDYCVSGHSFHVLVLRTPLMSVLGFHG
jgi:hypothetical protein